MHRNPVARKLVLHPKDWAWSSWSHYEKRETGLIRIDALGTQEASRRNCNVKNRTLERHKGAAPSLTFAFRFSAMRNSSNLFATRLGQCDAAGL